MNQSVVVKRRIHRVIQEIDGLTGQLAALGDEEAVCCAASAVLAQPAPEQKAATLLRGQPPLRCPQTKSPHPTPLPPPLAAPLDLGSMPPHPP